MYGLTIGTKHTYTDWGLIFDGDASYITPARAKRTSVDLPGSDGSIDLTYALSSKLHYYDRDVHLEFKRFNGMGSFLGITTQIQNYLQGKSLHITKDWDPTYYWDAILEVSDIQTDEGTGTVVIEGTCKPYKYKQTETSYSITGNATITCVNSKMEVCPVIVNTEELTITFDSVSATLSAGEHQVSDIIFTEGNNVVTLVTGGSTTIKYREGSL